MANIPGSGLVSVFLATPAYADRATIVNTLIENTTADEVFSTLFAALNSAVDQLRAVVEIATDETHLTSEYIAHEVGKRLEQRGAAASDYLFTLIVDGLDDPPSQQ
jgi:hypothetical protein